MKKDLFKTGLIFITAMLVGIAFWGGWKFFAGNVDASLIAGSLMLLALFVGWISSPTEGEVFLAQSREYGLSKERLFFNKQCNCREHFFDLMVSEMAFRLKQSGKADELITLGRIIEKEEQEKSLNQLSEFAAGNLFWDIQEEIGDKKILLQEKISVKFSEPVGFIEGNYEINKKIKALDELWAETSKKLKELDKKKKQAEKEETETQ